MSSRLTIRMPWIGWLTVLLLSISTTLFAATIELLSGAKVEGQVTRKDEDNLYVEVKIGDRTIERSYPLKSIHAVTINGNRRIINEKPNTGAEKKTPTTGGKSRAELDRIIDAEGKAPPDWFAATPLEYPDSLDLSWPEKPPGNWNNQKNVNQYFWDIINPNPSRWRSGIKLVHHLLTMHKDDPDKRERAMLRLANMYNNLLEDHARSAFWLRAAGVEKNPAEYAQSAVTLAENYWRLGYPEEALKILTKTPGTFSMAKLLGDMGQTDKAVQLALAGAKDSPDFGYLVAADALRVAGRTKEAMKYYQMVVDIPVPPKPQGRFLKNRNRAIANLEGIKLFDQFEPTKIADGDYNGSSQGYEAAVEVAVTMKDGKIASVRVTNHREKQFYSSIKETPARIIAKQHVKGVDATSGATITSDAIINATAKALAKVGKS